MCLRTLLDVYTTNLLFRKGYQKGNLIICPLKPFPIVLYLPLFPLSLSPLTPLLQQYNPKSHTLRISTSCKVYRGGKTSVTSEVFIFWYKINYTFHIETASITIGKDIYSFSLFNRSKLFSTLYKNISAFNTSQFQHFLEQHKKDGVYNTLYIDIKFKKY